MRFSAKPKLEGMDRWLLTFLVMLGLISIVNMYTIDFTPNHSIFFNHLRNILIGLLVLFFTTRIPPNYVVQLALPAYALSIVLLVLVYFLGITKKGSQRWLNVGIVIQPSELLKITIPLVLAWWFYVRGEMRNWSDYIVPFIFLLIPVVIIAIQPDLGTALLVFISGFILFFFVGLSWKYFAVPLFLFLMVLGYVYFDREHLCGEVDWWLLHEYQKHRICTLLDPTGDPLGKGYHTIQGMIAVGSGGILGRGIFNSTQARLEFIPEHTTDFVVAAFAEQFGLVGCLVLIFLYAGLCLRGLYLSLKMNMLYYKLLVSTLSTMLFIYTFINIGMNVGILPIVGVPLPFFSYGGTGLVSNFLVLGLILGGIRWERLQKE
ncbi:MAG: rod shape-determining protein RodA [Gammaproteobacteria bacterium]|nr:rod shape-determining protein RodA [Gammaproteobacteria bacterium]